jgi:hypothetical protein
MDIAGKDKWENKVKIWSDFVTLLACVDAH